jgi:cellulose biosynthesis protein BcsQ
MAKRIVAFNHKGGVSKTTSIYNIGWMLSKGHNVLLVDGDPQCNLSSLILGDDFEKYYLDDATKHQNIKDGVQFAFSGKTYPIQAVTCFSPPRSPSLYLLAGHANLLEYEAALTFAQISNTSTAILKNLPGAFSELIRLTEEKYNIDYTLIDVSPALGSINQNLFLSSHAFIVPTNPDPFSIMAIDTLSKVLSKWFFWKKNNISIFADSAYPMLEGEPKFLGSLIHDFNVRYGRVERTYHNNIDEIKAKISGDFFDTITQAGMTLTAEQYTLDLIDKHYCLAKIPNFGSFLQLSYQAGIPIFELSDEDIAKTEIVIPKAIFEDKKEEFTKLFQSLTQEILGLLQYV